MSGEEAVFLDIFETALGWAGVYCACTGVRAIALPCESVEGAKRSVARLRQEWDEGCKSGRRPLSREPLGAIGPPEEPHDLGRGFDPRELAGKVGEGLAEYFEGRPWRIDTPLDLSHSTSFDRLVLLATRQVPWGTVTTYGELASVIGCPKGARAVGASLGRNLLPVLVPCHRVIRKDGGLGGFREGTNWKKRLLNLEGHRF